MSGRARRATRPTSCLFGATLGLRADCDRTRAMVVLARVRSCPPALWGEPSGTCPRSGGCTNRPDRSWQGEAGRDGQQRRRARPSIKFDQARDRSQIASVLKISVFDISGFRFLIFLAIDNFANREIAKFENGSTKPRNRTAPNHGSVEPFFMRRTTLFLRHDFGGLSTPPTSLRISAPGVHLLHKWLRPSPRGVTKNQASNRLIFSFSRSNSSACTVPILYRNRLPSIRRSCDKIATDDSSSASSLSGNAAYLNIA